MDKCCTLLDCLSGGPLYPVGRCPLLFVSRDSGTNIASGGGICVHAEEEGKSWLHTYSGRSDPPWSRAVKKKGLFPSSSSRSSITQMPLSLCFPHLLSRTNRSGAQRSPFFLSRLTYQGCVKKVGQGGKEGGGGGGGGVTRPPKEKGKDSTKIMGALFHICRKSSKYEGFRFAQDIVKLGEFQRKAGSACSTKLFERVQARGRREGVRRGGKRRGCEGFSQLWVSGRRDAKKKHFFRCQHQPRRLEKGR